MPAALCMQNSSVPSDRTIRSQSLGVLRTSVNPKGWLAVTVFVSIIVLAELAIVIGYSQGLDSQRGIIQDGLKENTHDATSIYLHWYQNGSSISGAVSPPAVYYLQCSYSWNNTPLGGYCASSLITTNQNGSFSGKLCDSCGWAIPTTYAITVSLESVSATVEIHCWGTSCSAA
jgi:hypothetical protein